MHKNPPSKLIQKDGYIHNLGQLAEITTIDAYVTPEGSAEQIIAIGDNENDVEMFKEAGISVAMGNAKNPVKQQADFAAAKI